jgi:hypothetical protein
MSMTTQSRGTQEKAQSISRAPMRVEILTDEGMWAELVPAATVNGASSDSSKAAIDQQLYRWRRWGTVSLGALVTVALHALLLGTLLFGTAGRPLRPKQTLMAEGAAASAKNTQATEFVSQLIVLNSHSITLSDEQDDSAYAAMLHKAAESVDKDIKLANDVASPSVPQVDISGSQTGTDDQSPTIEATGNEAGRAMMFGRYMNQVKARIDRAWDYPHGASATFQCKVQIRQDNQGGVKEITLQRCGDDPTWQLSLVQAIQRASPLSAPPEESVFSEVITLSFDAKAPVVVAGSASAASWPSLGSEQR